MPTLPPGFVPTVAAYSQGDPGGVLRTEVAGGPARYRLDYDLGYQAYAVTLALDALKFSVWAAFWTHVIQKGALAFDMRLDSGLGVAAHSVHVMPDSYSATRQGSAYMVQFSVECQSAVYALSDAAVSAYGLSASSLPAGLVPVISSYSQSGPGGVMRDDVAGGVAAYGLDWGRGLQRFNCTLILTATQYATWSVWYHRLIKKGAYTFDMPLDSGFGTQPHACNILPDSYQASRTGGIATVVSFVVEAESKALDMSAAEAQSMVDVYNAYGAESNALLARIAQFANVDSLALNF